MNSEAAFINQFFFFFIKVLKYVFITTMIKIEETSRENACSYKEWPGKTIYFNFDSIFGDFFFEIFRVIQKRKECSRKLN